MSTAVRILGPVEVVGPDGALPLGGPKERCLLAVLAVHAGEVVGEDRLIDALWAEAPPRTAGKTLQNHVLRLRRALRGCPAAAIRTRSPGYLLDTGDTDARLAADLVADGRRLAVCGAHAAAATRFAEALALWRGPALCEFADRTFAGNEAARLDELRASAAEDRVDSLLALGRHHETVAVCEDLVAAAPLRERRWVQLMLALYRDGRQAEALHAYRRLREVLGEQLGVEPGPDARRMQAAVLAQDRGLLLAGPEFAPPRTAATGVCFGRDRELAWLLDHLDAAAAGRGGVALVLGEPGIGKTRLLAELAAAVAGRSARVLTGRCVEGSGGLPFQPFAEAIDAGFADPAPPPGAEALGQLVPRWAERVLPAPGPPLRPDELRLRLLDAVSRVLDGLAAATPVLLMLDDLHWADDGTVAMLRHVARHTRGKRLLVVGAYRGEEVTGEHPLGDALGALRSEADCTALRLAGIGPAAVDQLLAATVGAPVAAELVTAIMGETGGNPFFAREVARHLLEDGRLAAGEDGELRTRLPLAAVPEGVRQVIRRRRRRLSEPANRLLDVAAGIEGPFLFEPVRTVAGLPAADALGALDELLESGLVVPNTAADRYDFTHALIRHTVHQGLNPSRRLRLHRDLGAALDAARTDGMRVTAAETAVQYHRAAALPGAAAGVPAALSAADAARAVGAHDEQATFLQIAADLLGVDDERRPDVLGRLAVALAWALRFDAAVVAARAAAAAGSGARVLARVASVLATAGSNRHAWQLAGVGLAAAGGPDGDDPVSWAILTLLDLDRQEAADPEYAGMPLDRPGRRAALRVLHESGRLAQRGDLARYAVAAVYGCRDRIPAGAAGDPTVAGFLLGDYAGAVPLFARDAEAAEGRGQLAFAVYCWAGAARCQVALGRLAAAIETLAHVRSLVARVPGLELGWQLMHHQGAEDALAMALDEGWDQRLADYPPWLPPGPDRHWGGAATRGIGARAQARLGRTEAALGLLGAPVRALRQAPAWAPNYGRMACDVAEALWLLGRRDHLAVVEAALRDRALPADFRFPMTDARQALARLCALDGRRDEAHRWFDAARSVLDAQGAAPLRAVVDHDEALMHSRAGDPAAAAQFAEAAAAAFRRLGMTGWERRLRCR